MEDRFQFARTEFAGSVDDDEKARLVYAYFGLAIYRTQCIEQSLSTMLWTYKMHEEKPTRPEESAEIIDAIENSKATMGKLIRNVKDKFHLLDKESDELASILQSRNYLAHQFFKIHIQKFFTDNGKLEMIQEFCTFINQAETLDKKLQTHYRAYTDSFGITQEIIDYLVEELRKTEEKRATL